ncbi:MAG: DUF3795 domain-containing protein [Dehalococcoidales bacterium]|nr:DUF3795 domain-containing protein [Dehalococcoidales bacterium]
MEKQIAYCGLVCTDCKAYIATEKNDDKMREEVAAEWTKEYHHDFKPEDIKCDGCLPKTVKTIGHLNVCPIRKCGQEKGVINCAYCEDYACEELNKYFEMAPVMKANLEEIRKGMK